MLKIQHIEIFETLKKISEPWAMIYQQVTLSGDAEWPKVADAVIEALQNVSRPLNSG